MKRMITAVVAAMLYVASAVPGLADPGNSDFQRWVKQLSSRRAAERVEAAEMLGRQGFEAAAEPLATALADADPTVRRAAASALWALRDKAAPAAGALRAALEDGDLEVVARSAGALDAMGTPQEQLAPAWQRALGSSELSTRFMAARGLIGYDRGTRVLPHLLEYLDRQTERIANPATEFRARNSAREAQGLAERALQRLVATQERALVEPMAGRAGSDHPSQAAILKAMSRFDPAPDGWDDLLARAMGSRVPAAREAAAELARDRLAPDQAARWAPALTRLLDDPEGSVRSAALWTVNRAGGLAAAAAPALLGRLAAEQDANAREGIVEALGQVGDRTQPIAQGVKDQVAAQAREPLERAMKQDPESKVRRAALVSFNRLALPADEAVATLASVAQTSMDDEVTWQALQALRNRGLEAAPALSVIRELRAHRDPQVAEYAATIARELETDMADRTARPGAVPAPAATAEVRTAAATPRRPDAATEAQGLAVLRQRGAEFSESAFMQALMMGDGELVEAFLNAGMGATHSFEVMNGRQPLHLLFFGGSACSLGVRPTPAATRAIVDLLVSRGAGVNDGDQMGITPLMFAADKCDHPTISALLAAGALADARNSMGMSALEMAIWSGNDGLQALIDAGARLAPDTALAYREAYKDNPAALELISKASAR